MISHRPGETQRIDVPVRQAGQLRTGESVANVQSVIVLPIRVDPEAPESPVALTAANIALDTDGEVITMDILGGGDGYDYELTIAFTTQSESRLLPVMVHCRA